MEKRGPEKNSVSGHFLHSVNQQTFIDILKKRILVNSGKHDNKLAILTGNIFSSVPEFVNTVLAAYNPLTMFT